MLRYYCSHYHLKNLIMREGFYILSRKIKKKNQHWPHVAGRMLVTSQLLIHFIYIYILDLERGSCEMSLQTFVSIDNIDIKSVNVY